MNLEGDGPEVPGGEITKLVTAVTQMAGQLRQIKILVLIYAVASLSVSIGAFVYSATTFSPPAEYDHEPRESEAVAADDQAESVGPAGWPRAVTHPWLPQIRTCPIRASGSSGYGFAARA